MKIIIGNSNPILDSIFKKANIGDKTSISDKDELIHERINTIKPNNIFFSHWSYIIPENIFNNYEN